MSSLAAYQSMMSRDRKREGLRVCRAAWLLGVTVREYRELEAGDRQPGVDTWERMCEVFGWPQQYEGSRLGLRRSTPRSSEGRRVTSPVVFISHFTVKEGSLEALKGHAPGAAQGLQEDKPRTSVFVAYVSGDGASASFIHVFVDADAMDSHIEGAMERSRAAYEFMSPAGWEIYGRASDAAMRMFEQAAADAGVSLRMEPEYLAGFLRLGTPS
jgi:hypothetical protein